MDITDDTELLREVDERRALESITREDQLPVRPALLELFEITELEKYFTDAELADHPGRRR